MIKISACALLLVLLVPSTQGGSHRRRRMGSSKKFSSIDPLDFFIGLWEGIDPLDGSQIQRTFLPVFGADAKNNFTVTGRNEFSQLCGAGIMGNITEAPPTTANIVPALITGFGSVDEDAKVLEFVGGITCFGDPEPRIDGIPARYVAITDDLLAEIPVFRQEAPIYLWRITPVGELDDFF